MRILIIEDDKAVAAYIVSGLAESGHTVNAMHDGVSGLEMAQTDNYDVLVVDRMLPRMDGLTIIKTLRAQGYTNPVLILSALGDVDDRITGLRAGGDDYLVKPFVMDELLARVEALARRMQVPASAVTKLSTADLEMDLLARTVTRAGKAIDLQAREFMLLEYLLRHKGQLVTRTMLLENVWDYNFDPQTNIIDVHISRLRGKILEDHENPLLKTVRGAGYILEDR